MASVSIVIRTTVGAVVGSKVNENLAVETSSLGPRPSPASVFTASDQKLELGKA